MAHTHAHDSLYLFLNPTGARVKIRVMAQGCIMDAMEFGEVFFVFVIVGLVYFVAAVMS